MPEGRMNFESITQIYREEKRKKGLEPLPLNFFEMLRDYIRELQRSCDEEDRRAPHSPKSIMLRDELKKALKKRDEIWGIRTRKLVTLASSKHVGASVDTKPFTKVELRIFETIVRTLESGTQEVYGIAPCPPDIVEEARPSEEPRVVAPISKAAEPSPGSKGPEPSISTIPKTRESAQKQREPAGAVQAKESVPKCEDEVVVQILEDLPPVAGKDMNYLLKKGDVVSLPPDVAGVLCKSKKAEKVEMRTRG